MPNNSRPDSTRMTSAVDAEPGSDQVAALPEPTAERGAAGLGSSRTPAIIAAIVALVFLLVLVVLGILLFNNPPVAAVLRDIFIILLAIQSVFIGLLLIVAVVAIIYVALKMYDLTRFIENELRPILRRADDAMRTVHSRTVFLSDSAVKPVIEVMSWGAAMKEIIRAFTRPRK
ncbi:MAG: hypothetical protein Kow0063_10820 [Anaerolineae bacterium]